MTTFKTNELGWWIVPDNTVLPDKTNVPEHSQFGVGCTLGDGCKLGDECKLGNDCTLGDGCKLGDRCTLGFWCTLGDGCKLGDECKLGNDCTLGDRCTLGYGSILEGVAAECFLCLSNVDGSGRQIIVIKHANGIKVRAGCFCGTLDEFVAKAKSEGKLKYVSVITAVAGAI